MTDQPTLLIVDDDMAQLNAYSMLFARQPYRLLLANGGREALETLRSEDVDLVLTDMKMPDVDGMAVVRSAAALPSPPVMIVSTAYGTIETAVEAMRLGAFDYITKPVHPPELLAKISKSLEFCTLRTENEQLHTLLNDRFKFEGVVGVSPSMNAVIDQCRTVARSKATVLIEGDSGTGKELIARAIHFNSPRAKAPFVAIHCAAIPETLMEAELFGSEKGAFTGSTQRRIGNFESAHKGTIFLDELGEIPLSTQVKLLRVLEQRQITRVGGNKPVDIDIRLVTATNKNLEEEVKAGRFREDLFYRLNVVRVSLPGLSDRPEDIPSLADHFIRELARENEAPPVTIAPEVIERLMQYTWPGNIREMRNVIEQMVIFSDGKNIELENIPISIRSATADATTVGLPIHVNVNEESMSLAELEERHILRTLARMDQNRTRAAKFLGISRRTLQRKLKELGLEGHAAS